MKFFNGLFEAYIFKLCSIKYSFFINEIPFIYGLERITQIYKNMQQYIYESQRPIIKNCVIFSDPLWDKESFTVL